VTYLGIEDYVPEFQQGVETIAATHGARLLDLVGRTLVGTWLCWADGPDEWVADAPVVLRFDDVQLEIQHNAFDELSLTWGSIDVMRSIGFSDGDWHWRDDAIEKLSDLHGMAVVDVDLLAWSGLDLAHGSPAIGLVFDGGGGLTIYNALDENGLDFDAPRPEYRKHRLAD